MTDLFGDVKSFLFFTNIYIKVARNAIYIVTNISYISTVIYDSLFYSSIFILNIITYKCHIFFKLFS